MENDTEKYEEMGAGETESNKQLKYNIYGLLKVFLHQVVKLNQSREGCKDTDILNNIEPKLRAKVEV